MRAIVVVAVAGLVSTAGERDAFAQSAPPRIEVGAQVNVLRLSGSSDTNVGVGGRMTIDLARWLAVEGEYQFVPTDVLDDTSVLPDGSVVGIRYQRRRSTAVFGVKAGYRGERVGVFARVRPGFTTLTNRGVDCIGEVCALMLLGVPEYRREFALDLGGVVELYPSPRWVVRADVGTLRIRHRSNAPPCAGTNCTTSNLAASAGVGVRF